jgi:hydroxyacylglutathione hydrolase
LHNDYVSGGLALAQVTGAAYVVAAAEEVAFDRVPVADGDEVAVSGIGTLGDVVACVRWQPGW